MTPLVWFILFMATPIAIPGPLLRLLSSKFPLKLMQGNPGAGRPNFFLRIIFSSLLFGGILGVFGGCVAMSVWLLSPHLFSK
jgi:hypothetical protein